MSLYGALFTGISSMNANSKALSATSNNIANVNTVGYKNDQASFSSLMSTATSNTTFSAGGVQATRQQNIDQQGLIQGSAASTDLAMSGNGFFAVTRDVTGNANQTLYTRAGSFRPDGAGFLRNSAGLYILGWRLDAQGNLPANRADVGTINLNDLTGTAEPTTNMNLKANLQSSQAIQAATATYNPADNTNNMASGTVTPDFERTVQVYDTQGGAQQIRIGFLKTAANTWQYELMYSGNPANVTTAPDMPIGSGTLTFNADGTLATPATGSIAMTVPFDATTSGLNPQVINIGVGSSGQLSGVTQFDSPSTIVSAGVDGALFGGLTGVKVSEDGTVLAIFDNGVQRKVFQLPVAIFPNPNGLIQTSGNAYLQSQDSGAVGLTVAQTGGAGAISGNALESSTVDLAKEFTDLITTQRAYSAATRIITTSDDMLEELMRIKR
jgi:flagellar hook protein FlgE